MGIQQDPQFLLYYQTVQDRIKKAWNYVGGSGDLTTSVTFAIGPDGSLTGVKLTQSSRDPAFDDSVIRAIRRAAPFPPPPEKYRPEFGEGVDAEFKLGELKAVEIVGGMERRRTGGRETRAADPDALTE